MFWGEGTACAKAWVKGKNSTLYPSPPSTLCDSCSSPALAPIQLTQAPVPTASPWPVSSGAGARLGFWAEQRGGNPEGGTWAEAKGSSQSWEGQRDGEDMELVGQENTCDDHQGSKSPTQLTFEDLGICALGR